jgi:hypothetical protein
MKLPMLMAIRPTGKSEVKAKPICGGKPPVVDVPFRLDITGIIRKTIGIMNAEMSSLRRVNAFMSFRIKAASTEENPILPKMPVLGTYTPRLMVMAGGSYNPKREFRLVPKRNKPTINAKDNPRKAIPFRRKPFAKE